MNRGSICADCKWRDPMAHSYHIRCAKGLSVEQGRAKMHHEFRPAIRAWSGCGEWPWEFDEYAVISCDGHETDDKPA